ncbi:extracellular solute-binding protein [Shewanella sedimentimangrovi]|uniref:Extracellular solute-binding protein n=1 Tax=Shewanella sedimentimangrovi TaxID=2814293 RepID=A0ABX7QZF7_9GAMM|nr:extracellular solute-binding protein [Shewanella sedimentimangrovi]QSX36355.1 extracellular solute-binding protein [Shewanella sedimentimangrovi]
MKISAFFLTMLLLASQAMAKEHLTLLSWEGYVSENDLNIINQELERRHSPYSIRLYPENATNAGQIYNLLRTAQIDMAFVTLSFFKGYQGDFFKVLQPVNTKSTTLPQYQAISAQLTHLPDGSSDGNPYYIPFAQGSYGFYLNRSRYPELKAPASVAELWSEDYRGKFSLCRAQPIYNMGLTLQSLGLSPLALNQAYADGGRDQVLSMAKEGSAIDKHFHSLYAQAGAFWDDSPGLDQPGIAIVSSWGPEIAAARNRGEQWEKIRFKEGDMTWLDTLAFSRRLKAGKLMAAEIAANYFISEAYQAGLARALNLNSVLEQPDTGPDSVLITAAPKVVNNFVEFRSASALQGTKP